MSDRDRILFEMPDGKGGLAKLPTVVLKSVPKGDLWSTFKLRFSELGGEVIDYKEIGNIGASFTFDLTVPEAVLPLLPKQPNFVWEAEIGVTKADLAIAETGSFLISAKGGSSRLASLAPPVHIVLVSQADIVASLEEAFTVMPSETSVLITGPSRTADIEGVLVRGIHGPKRLILAVLP